jgi:para-nitrobenzyl esterase
MSDTFVQFAQEGNPNHGGVPKWNPYSLDQRAVFVFNAKPRVENDPRPEMRELYAKLAAGSHA